MYFLVSLDSRVHTSLGVNFGSRSCAVRYASYVLLEDGYKHTTGILILVLAQLDGDA